MCRKFIVLLVCLGAIVLSSGAQTVADLDEALQLSKALLATKADSAVCHRVALSIQHLCDTTPSAPQVPEALLLAAKLESKCRRTSDAVSLTQRIITQYTASTSAQEAFDFAWNILTDYGKTPLAGAKLATTMATALRPAAASRPYYRRAFDAYQQNDWWRSAADVGEEYLTYGFRTAPDAEFALLLSEAALKAGDTKLAERALNEFIAVFPDLPQVVLARARLGQAAEAAGRQDQAVENYSRAWSLYQKHRKKGEYNQPLIAHAAAQSLWTLQSAEKRSFESQTAPDLPVTKTALRQADQLDQAYLDVAITDPGMADQAFVAIGDLRVRLGDALLAEGFRSALASSELARTTPYDKAVPEYIRAVAAYTQAWERASLEPDDPQSEQIVRHASQSAFETAVGQGDALIAWSLELLKRAPQRRPGNDGVEPRFHLVVNNVAPLVIRGSEVKIRAFGMTDRMPVMAFAERTRPSLDTPLRAVVGELATLCTEETRSVASQSAQIARSHAMGYEGVSRTSILQSLETDFASLTRLTTEAVPAFGNLYAAATNPVVPEETRPYWDSVLVVFHSQYASLCRTMSSDLATALTKLKGSDETAAQFRNRLARLQAKATSEEFAGLVRWYDWVHDNDVEHPLNQTMAGRLAELDPLNYGSPYELPAASRKR
ncbi:tetratricopeptide repeat protein [bacterium]|nr:tetratricopeptide repeat protein [bacterium]MBU1985118.1 tetratricopeptide repeat protein [bacterium]